MLNAYDLVLVADAQLKAFDETLLDDVQDIVVTAIDQYKNNQEEEEIMAKMNNGTKKSPSEKVREDVKSVWTMMEQEPPKLGGDAPVTVKKTPKAKKGY